MPIWAWVLIGCAGVPLIMLPILAALLFPVFAQAREKARQTACASNEKQIALGMIMYAQDYDGLFPLRDQWQTGLTPYVPADNAFKCPAAREWTTTAYAYNAKLNAAKTEAIALPESLVLLFETAQDKENANGSVDILLKPGRHNKGNNFAYADGHVKWSDDKVPQTFDLKLKSPAMK
jgi:prepilin-type processing-associated H-X9-DG protein